ncbi:hypothetical protein Hanom_Chr01g00062071 [Helianthus anomalus]
MLHTKQENTTQKTSLVGERAHLVYKPNISCPYNRYETGPIPCNGISPFMKKKIHATIVVKSGIYILVVIIDDVCLFNF